VKATASRSRIIFLALLLSFAVLPASSAWASDNVRGPVNPSVQIALDAVDPGEAVPVIIYAAPGSYADLAGQLPVPDVVTPLPTITAVATTLNATQVAAIAGLPYVSFISADNPVFATDYVGSLDITNLSIGLGFLPAPSAGGPTGNGVTVAIIDSGVADSRDLLDAQGDSRVVGWVDLLKNKKHPYDDAGHGTFIAGLIAGNGAASTPVDQGGYATTQFRGVAPQADIVAIKALDQFGQGRSSGVVAAIGWAIAHKDQYNIRVLNISAGGNVPGPVEKDPMALAVEAAWKAGIVVVCAAGNEGDFGPGSILSPGNDPYVITVGAVDTMQTGTRVDDSVAHYSSVGPTLYDEFAKPDIVAPGNRVISLDVKASYLDRTFPQNVIDVSTYAPGAPASFKSQYFVLSGTSVAAPVVAGVAALMLSNDPSLTPDDVKVRLMASADQVAGATPMQQGAGMVDVPGALSSGTHANGPALSADLGNGTTVLTPDTYVNWDKYAWTKYAWTKYAWTKYAWTKYAWTKYAWTKYAWTKYAWTKYAWTKYAWTTVIDGQ
jgi:serine protease AprX